MTHQELLDRQATQILTALDKIRPGETLSLFVDETGRKHVRISVYCRATGETTESTVSGSSVRDVLAQVGQVLT
jgi:hypothetical protein